MKRYAIYYYTGKFLSQQICLIKKEKKKKKSTSLCNTYPR